VCHQLDGDSANRHSPEIGNALADYPDNNDDDNQGVLHMAKALLNNPCGVRIICNSFVLTKAALQYL
jgi:hypothetical protein